MQYENNLRKKFILQRERKKIVFQKSLFPKGTSFDPGGGGGGLCFSA